MRFGLPAVTLDVTHGGARLRRGIEVALRPYAPGDTSAAPADLVVGELDRKSGRLERHGPANDNLVTAHDGTRLFQIEAGRRCTVPDPLHDRPVRIDADERFAIDALVALLRPVLQISMLKHDSAAAHASSVEIGGRGVAIAGWSESGKTETALALMEGGAGFLSDKWTVIAGDGVMRTFPINVGVRGWVLPYLPMLRTSLPRHARMQLVGARMAAPIVDRIPRGRRRSSGARIIVDTLRRAVALADRAGLHPADIRAAYRQGDDALRSVPLDLFVHLVNTPTSAVSAEAADPVQIARRVARSDAYERRRYYALLERSAYATGANVDDSKRLAVDRETAVLTSAFARATVVEVRAPFPVDPRRVAGSIERWL